MSDYLDTTPDTLKPTPSGLMQKSAQEEAQAKALEKTALAGREKLRAERDTEQKRRAEELNGETASLDKANADLQGALKERPSVAMPSPEIGPPLDPEATQKLSWGMFTMGLVGVLGGRKHWNEATAAMDGMLQGFKAGAEDNIRENKAKFDREFRLAKEKEAAQTKVYDDLIASKKLSLNAVFDTMKIHAAAENDWAMWNAANAKDYDQLVTLASQRHTTADRLQVQATTLQDRIQAREEKRKDALAARDAKSNAKPSWPPEVIDYYAQRSRAGDQSWRTGLSRTAAGVANISAVDERVPTLSAEAGSTPGHDMALKSARDAMSAALKDREKFIAASNQFVGNFNKQADLVDKYLEKGVGGTTPVFNRWIQAGRKQIEGDTDVTKFDTAIRGLAREHQRIVTGVTSNAQLHVSSQATADELLNRDFTAGQVRGTLEVMREEAKNARDSGVEERDSLMKDLENLGASQKSAPGSPQHIDDLVKKYGG